MTVLSRSNGSSTTYTGAELAAIITGLEASNNTHQIAGGVAFIRIGALRLLILDVDALHNRRLLETYAIHYDSTNPYDLKFTSSNMDFNLNLALDGIGFSAMTPVSALSNINAFTYFVAPTDQYLEASTLVKSQGVFSTVPAQLKNLVAGNGCTLAETDDDVTLDVTAVTSFPPPIYGSSSISTAPLSSTTMWGGSNHALIFVSPLFAVQTDMGSGIVDGVTHDPVRVTHLILDQSYLDLETNNLIDVALLQHYTAAQVQTLINTSIATAKQEVLDSITFSDNFTVVRTPLALAVSGGGGGTETVLFQDIAVTDAPVASTDHYILGENTLAYLYVDGKSWTLSLDMWIADWSSSGQSLALYGGRQGFPDGSRASPSHLMNLYYDTGSAGPHIFGVDQTSAYTLSPVSGISDSTWFTLAIQYNHVQSKFSVFVNNILQGSYNTVRESQKYTSINQLMFMSPGVGMKRRNVSIQEGLVQ